MARFDPIALHPLAGRPYDKIRFVRMTPSRVPLYRVEGSSAAERGAGDALRVAFAIHGGECFYCRRRFKPQPLSRKQAHRDHVVPCSRGGSDRLHNLVIACTGCGAAKADRPIRHFDPAAADRLLVELERHIARALGARQP